MAGAKRNQKDPKYNEDFFRGMGGPGPTAVGLFMILLIIVGLYLAFSKQIPFTSPGYEIKATFANAVRIVDKTPVRIAGVNVGKVTGVERKGNASEVTFTVDDAGRPIHTDASAEIRPRIFLEGNFFVDLHPGSPSAPELPDNGQIPISRTATAVQLDEVLTALQKPERANLQLLLEGLGTAFTYQPTPADDVDQDVDVQGESAAKALNDAFESGGKAGRTTAIVNEALLGSGKDDLSKLIVAGNRVSGALVSRETQLKDLISNFNVTVGALADESGNLSESIQLLQPTLTATRRSLVNLNSALPPLRALAIASEPAIAELPATIAAGLPWIDQARPLLSGRELGGIASLLERSTPASASALHETVTGLPELTNFNRCIDENLVPAGNVRLQDSFAGNDFSSGQPNYREFFYSAAGVAGESANYDGNGIYVRLQPGGGPVPVKVDNPSGGFEAEEMFGNTISPPLGTRPRLGGMPPFRPDVPCFESDLPDLNGPAAAVGPPSPEAYAP
jgi:phospholipid/cholesterol/gamma-HCH transport system substrate-binding protein